MKHLKKFFLLLLVVIIIATLSFVGCDYNSEESLKETVVTSLEEKYGEEFICRDIRANGGSSYFAVCSPTSNQDIKFTTLFLTGGKITYDGYYSSCVAEKIEEDVQKELENVFNDFYLHSCMTVPLKSRETNDIYAENVRNKSFDIDEYVNLANEKWKNEKPSMSFYLCVNTSVSNKLSFEEEYDALFDVFAAVDTLGMNSSIVLKFVPEEKYTDCVEYLENSDYVYDTLKSALEKYPIDNPNMPSDSFFSFAEGKGKLTLTKEEYIEQREELN